ncbi:hypothetical protein MMC27_007039 [Xylographa pallens]|nr:hypothetical protein [Xylographa pallens]
MIATSGGQDTEHLKIVLITLKPLDYSLERTFQLNPAKSFIEIGRASKTASKGLAAAKDNAWFESPIMSRSHAELTLVTGPERVLHLKDLQSTHGTFIGSKKLDAEVDYPLKNGDTITFGQRVTSGTTTYPAKDFVIEYQWQQWSNPTPVTSPESRSKAVKPGFHVPYDYEDEDSEDDVSREASVELVIPSMAFPNTRPAKALDIEVLSATKVSSSIVNQNSAPLQTKYPIISDDTPAQNNTQSKPHHHEVYDLTVTNEAKSAKDLKTKSKSMGSSQANPINLEGPLDNAPQEIISDSDDEPPETLPISQASLKALPAPFSADPFRYYSAMVDAAMTANNNVQREIEKQAASEAMIADSDIETSGADFNYSTSEDELGPSSDIDCEGTDEHNWSDDFSEDEDVWEKFELESKARQALPVVNVQNLPSDSASAKAVTSVQSSHILVKDSQALTPPQCRVDTAGVLEVSKPTGVAAAQWNEPLPRAPSPSDAALAKPPYARVAHADEIGKGISKRHPADVMMWQGSHREDQGLQSGEAKAYNPHLGPWAHSAQAVSAPYNSLGSDEYFENIDRCLPLYDDGPFTGWSYVPANHIGGGNNNNFAISSHKSQMPVTFAGYTPISDQYEVRMNSNRANAGSSVPWMSYPAVAIQSQSPSDPVSHLPDTSSGKSSKLPISDIVNQSASQMNASAPTLKRKADEMSIAGPEESLPRPHVTNVKDDSQDSCLPDAQPRENLGPADITLQENVTQSIHGASQNTSASSQPLVKGEPARKRIRASNGGSKSVKAFLSGMLVGCVGLAGACAAFIATIPDAVKAEALREF